MKEKIGKYASQAAGFVAFVLVMKILFPAETQDWLDPPNSPEDCDWFCSIIHYNFSPENFKAIAAMTFATLKLGLAALVAVAAFVAIRTAFQRVFRKMSSIFEFEMFGSKNNNEESHPLYEDQNQDL